MLSPSTPTRKTPSYPWRCDIEDGLVMTVYQGSERGPWLSITVAFAERNTVHIDICPTPEQLRLLADDMEQALAYHRGEEVIPSVQTLRMTRSQAGSLAHSILEDGPAPTAPEIVRTLCGSTFEQLVEDGSEFDPSTPYTLLPGNTDLITGMEVL